MSLSPTPCNQTTLVDMWALASQVDNPIPPYPLFYANRNCAGGQTGANFPAYFLPSNCPTDSSTIPTSQDNCLRIISSEDYDNGNHILTSDQVNYLPGATDVPHSNIFPDSFNRLFSWFVPPNVQMIFFAKNPSKFLPKTLVQVTFGANYLQTDSCIANIRLSDGTSFWTNPPNECNDPLNFHFQHATPWFIVIQDESYQSMILDMCTTNRDILLGTNSLREVWHPRSNGCDLFMSSLCAVSSDPALTETCSCFTQQKALDAKYPGLNVGVCCFGVDPSGDIQKACAFNTNAYKTQAIQDNCCSFAECQSIVSHNTPLTNIQCNGDLVEFPQVIPSVSATPVVITTTTTDIPSYVWVIIGLGVGIIALCLLVAAWAVPFANSTNAVAVNT